MIPMDGQDFGSLKFLEANKKSLLVMITLIHAGIRYDFSLCIYTLYVRYPMKKSRDKAKGKSTLYIISFLL